MLVLVLFSGAGVGDRRAEDLPALRSCLPQAGRPQPRKDGDPKKLPVLIYLVFGAGQV